MPEPTLEDEVERLQRAIEEERVLADTLALALGSMLPDEHGEVIGGIHVAQGHARLTMTRWEEARRG